MRGLSNKEREELLGATAPFNADPNDASALANPDDSTVLNGLEQRGCVRVVELENDDWVWQEWRATELGHLALRVCPPEEA